MSNKHEKKFFINTLIGLLFTTASAFTIVYICAHPAHHEDWIFWGVIAAIGLNTGFLFIGSGVVHKVKADLIRRQKQKSKGEKSMAD